MDSPVLLILGMLMSGLLALAAEPLLTRLAATPSTGGGPQPPAFPPVGPPVDVSSFLSRLDDHQQRQIDLAAKEFWQRLADFQTAQRPPTWTLMLDTVFFFSQLTREPRTGLVPALSTFFLFERSLETAVLARFAEKLWPVHLAASALVTSFQLTEVPELASVAGQLATLETEAKQQLEEVVPEVQK
jgi:hypothetical protein